MKVKLFIIAICFIIPHTLMFSQNTYEKTYNGQTYMFDRTYGLVSNKNNKIQSELITNDCRVSLHQTTPIEDIYKKVFSKERVNDLKPTSFFIICVCDSEGKVLELNFLLNDNNIDNIKLSEIQKLESLLKDYTFELSGSCPGQKFYKIYMPCRFRNLY